MSKRQNQPARSTGESKPQYKFERIYACAYLLAVTLICYFPVLQPGRTFLPADLVLLIPPWAQHSHEIAPDFHAVARPVWDPLFQFYPARKFLADSIKTGVVPWHNPYSFSGTPFIADGQSAFFYPINWLFAALPLQSAFGIVAALHTFLAGLFFTLFARRKKMGWEASLAGATVWMFCGTMAAWQMWQVVDSALCWVPLGLYFADKLTEDANNTPANTAGLGIATGMMLLAGHLQFAFYGLVVIALYSVVAVVSAKRFSAIPSLIKGSMIGVAIACVQILPTLDLLHHSLRGNYPIDVLRQTQLPATQLGLALMPELAGGERDWMMHPYLGAVNYFETCCYFGASAFFFAALAVFQSDSSRKKAVWFWLGIGLLGILIACGTPIYTLLYYGIPLFKSFHGVARALVLTELSVAMLCVYGVQAAFDSSKAELLRGVKLATISTLLITIAMYGLMASRSSDQLATILTHDWLTYGLSQLGRSLAFIIVAALVAVFCAGRFRWIAVAVIAADMLLFAAGLSPGAPSAALYPRQPAISIAAQTADDGRVLCLGDSRRDLDRMIPNSAMSVGLRDVSGSDPLLLASYDRFLGDVNQAQTGSRAPSGEGIVAQGGSDALNLLNVTAIISPQPLNIPNYQLVDSDDVYIYRNQAAKGEAWFEQPGAGSISDIDISTQRINFNIQTSTPADLGISEVADPAWKLSIDGKRTEWSVAHTLLIAAPVAAGDHAVELRYLPQPGQVGLYIACAGWLAIAWMLTVSARKIRQ